MICVFDDLLAQVNVAVGVCSHSSSRLGVSITARAHGARSCSAVAKSQLAVQLLQQRPQKSLLFLPCWHFACGTQMFAGYYVQREMAADK